LVITNQFFGYLYKGTRQRVTKSGKGELKHDDGRILTPNDLFPLTNDIFRLYYTFLCEDQQNIDVYIEDSFGQVVQKSFGWQNETAEKEEE
jgi:hypothetical protein